MSHCSMDFDLLAGLGDLHSCFHLCFHCTMTFALHFGQGICRRQHTRRFPFYFHIPKQKKLCDPMLWFKLCLFFSEFVNVWRHILTRLQNLVMFFFFFPLVHGCILLAHFTSPGWRLVSLVLPELCILMMTLPLLKFYLERMFYVFLCLD